MLHAYGRFMRPLTFSEPAPMPLMKYRRGGEFRALWNGVFRSDAGELEGFLVNASQNELPFRSTMPLGRHGLHAGAVVDVDLITPDGDPTPIEQSVRGVTAVEGVLPARSIRMYHVRPVS